MSLIQHAPPPDTPSSPRGKRGIAEHSSYSIPQWCLFLTFLPATSGIDHRASQENTKMGSFVQCTVDSWDDPSSYKKLFSIDASASPCDMPRSPGR